MNGTPSVSVVVGVYNKERYVGECLRSVLAQTYGDFELIVVDDCSTDRSVAEIQAIRDARVRFIPLPVNSRRPAVPRNRGVELAQGKYIAFLDADDRWLPGKLEKQVAFMEAHPEVGFSHAACWKIDGAGARLCIRHEGALPPSGDYWRVLLDRVWVSISASMATRELIARAGPFVESMKWRGEEDAEFFLRCAARTPFGTIPEPLAEYRTGIDNISAGKNWKGVGRDFPLYRHILGDPSLWKGCLTRREMTAIVADMAEEGAFYWRERGESGRALWFAWQLVRLSPLAGRGWRQLLAAGLRRR